MDEAFVQIIKENEGLIFKISSVYTNDESDRQDLYQEIVFQLWRSFGSFRNESKVSTWMYRVALNTAISRIRKEKKNGHRVPIDQVVLDISENKDHEYQERVSEMYVQRRQARLGRRSALNRCGRDGPSAPAFFFFLIE